jgi:hypothetical protein
MPLLYYRTTSHPSLSCATSQHPCEWLSLALVQLGVGSAQALASHSARFASRPGTRHCARVRKSQELLYLEGSSSSSGQLALSFSTAPKLGEVDPAKLELTSGSDQGAREALQQVECCRWERSTLKHCIADHC